ncbi:MAG: hypothetical protein NMNS01_30240 [Nitrosomonas sp.]|nr:MAG: hypothetical protein NMNS01_30240 [Nitrosomonas sp.]
MENNQLVLSTDITLIAEQVVESYSQRWPIEPMFNQLKQAWGMKEAWQQTRQTLLRWMHITMVGYGLVQLSSCLNSQAVDALCQHSPWRKQNPKTAGQISKGLTGILRHDAVRQWWNAKCKKFMPPNGIIIEILNMSGLRQRNKRKIYRTAQQTRLKIVSLDGQVRSKL